ncbi:hypothetical protein HN954_01060 [bacterium]|jgi:hypothetical protein|nr:hypothetical protein [bacterium]MBT6831793.1 hypothetical protein [bacterium]MBT6996000.1 hypothetical protein [bacterium]MBT7772629.1 hypothetical protein [bacterium]
MKKSLLVLVAGFLFFTSAQAQPLPPEINVDFQVKNVSRQNQDGTQISARPGDVLRYEIKLSENQIAENVQLSVDVANLLSVAEFVSDGGGVVQNGELVFPTFSSAEVCGTDCPEWQKEYSFFVRIKKECASATNISVQIENLKLQTVLDCELVKSGPNGVFIAVAAMMLLLGYVFLGHRSEKL